MEDDAEEDEDEDDDDDIIAVTIFLFSLSPRLPLHDLLLILFYVFELDFFPSETQMMCSIVKNMRISYKRMQI